MNKVKQAVPNSPSDSVYQKISAACQLIAPTWPLDQLIAVNPWWEMRAENYHEVTAKLGMLAQVNSFMPLSYYQQMYRQGNITDSAIQQMALIFKPEMSFTQVKAWMNTPTKQPAQFHSLAELFDRERATDKMSWSEESTHQISQFCAIHFQQQGSDVEQTKTSKTVDLYQHWLEVTRRDRGLSILMREPGLTGFFADLPLHVDELFAMAEIELSLGDEFISDYSHGLLLRINGWASWVAYGRFQGNLDNQIDKNMQSLLAIKMAWELVVWRYHKQHKPLRFAEVELVWQTQQSQLSKLLTAHREMQQVMQVWQSALELSYQQELQHKLLKQDQSKCIASPKLQAAFCIDVRSEVLRRSLEKQSDAIQTLGFAGFFGLPIYFQPANTALTRPQLPGLLKPSIKVEPRQMSDKKSISTRRKARWQNWSKSAPASFSMVESAGWWYAFKLLKQSFFSKSTAHPMNQLAQQSRWRLSQNDHEMDDQAKAGLAKTILHAMGLVEFAPCVLLVGHGSHSTNNLQAAGLDCGACGGQTGEINVRVLAEILNDVAVRKLLSVSGINIPLSTHFVAALHNTTTDEIICFDQQPSNEVIEWLQQATISTQQERAIKIDPSWLNKTNQQRHQAFVKRANDWSETRPEWGLASNAAFIMAPRSWTRGLDLAGRCFLHDYDWQKDADSSVLELLLTAPMVVTHWINMQYNTSMTDNHKYGSGNKVLHNAVNGSMGVFEGNGGDLRIGLAKQSLHDGQQWMHIPQRLSVYVAAPRAAIDAILNKHTDIRSLVINQWLYLFQWQEDKFVRIELL